MQFKLLWELDSHELRTVFRRVGKRGEFEESQAIVQLTIFLVKIGQDPFSYRFPISEHSDGVKSSVIKEAEVNEVQDATVATGPNNATGLYANGVAECVRVISVPESKHLVHIEALDDVSEEALDDVSEDEQDSGSREMLVSSNPGLADGGSVDSESMPATVSSITTSSLSLQSSVYRTKAISFVFVSSFKVSSFECLRCSDMSPLYLKKCKRNTTVEENGSLKEAKIFHLLMNLHREFWPPDSLKSYFWKKRFDDSH